jgi:hypothetical protein
MSEAEARYLEARDTEAKARFELRVAEKMVLSEARVLTLAFPEDYRFDSLRRLVAEQEQLEALAVEAAAALDKAFDAHMDTAQMGVSNVH